jgi:5-oxoprolinase (ATP-hydrolysing) subunit A
VSTDAPVIDLNADLGEGFGPWSMGDDDALLDVVTSANVACGFHAGDARIMRRTCDAAAVRGVVVGAHVSYRDLEGFGRRELAVPVAQLTDELLYQIGALETIARAAGAPLRYVKAHGALYNRCAHDPGHAGALVHALVAHGGGLTLLAAPGSVVAALAADAGLPVVTEGFVDRAYRADGTLVPRREPGAVHDSPATCVAQALRITRLGTVTAADGSDVALAARSLCVHGDTPHAVATAAVVRQALVDAGVAVRAFA